jgi:CRISPR-associated protein Csx17
MPTLTLSGCAPIPLAHYLKALGILRLVSEQKDPHATGRWHRDQFVLTSTLDREGLLKFFLEEYRPTEIVVPWSGSDYFAVDLKSPSSTFDKTPTASSVIEALLSTKTERFADYRSALRKVFEAMEKANVLKKKDIEGSGGPQRTAKADLLRTLRGSLPDAAVAWIDAAAVVEPLAVTFNTLLGGGGGSDGNSHFSDNFMQCLWLALPDFTNQQKKTVPALGVKTGFDSEAALAESIFNFSSQGTKIRGLSPVLFDSTRVGGVNQSSGFEGTTASNPWDFILMIEGSVLFAGAIAKKLDSSHEPSARFPFLFAASASGVGSSYLGESSGRELWLPVWSRACRLSELQMMFAEGRIERFGKPARTGVEAFMGAAQLGFDRGITEFQRVGFYKGRVGGDNYFTAIDRGRIKPSRNLSVDLLQSCHGWIDQFRRVATKDTAPASARRALSQLESAIVDLCISQSAERLLRVFLALGHCQATAARSFSWASKPETHLQPLFGLRKAWLHPDLWNHPRTGTEFRLAASLASLTQAFNKKWLPFRRHLEPVDSFYSKEKGTIIYRWAENPTNDVQWSQAPLITMLNAILSRRLLKTPDEDKLGGIPANLTDIKAFIEGETDDDLLSSLLWSMSLINWREQADLPQTTRERQAVPPTFFALLKLCFAPAKKELPTGILPVPIVPTIHRLAATGSGDQAAAQALRRLRASGYDPALRQLPVQGDYARRTAAALLFPVSNSTLKMLYQQTTRPDPASASKSAPTFP